MSVAVVHARPHWSDPPSAPPRSGEQIRLLPRDTTWIPPSVSHRFRNPSATAVMTIFWIYGRLDATRTLTATGQTHFVSAEQGG